MIKVAVGNDRGSVSEERRQVLSQCWVWIRWRYPTVYPLLWTSRLVAFHFYTNSEAVSQTPPMLSSACKPPLTVSLWGCCSQNLNFSHRINMIEGKRLF